MPELLILIGLIVFLLALLFSFVPVGLWISALFAGVRVSLLPWLPCACGGYRRPKLLIQ